MTDTRSDFDRAVASASRITVAALQPEELPVLEELLDPPRRLLPWRRSGVAGFGIGDVVEWVSPSVVMAALWYGRALFDPAGSLIEKRTRKTIGGLSRRRHRPVTPPTGPAIGDSERAEHTRMVRDLLVSADFDADRALFTADMIVGELLRVWGEANGDD